MQTFKARLFLVQNFHANEVTSCPFVHDAKPLCKRSSPFCSSCKIVMQPFKAALFLPQKRMVISGVSPFTSTYKPISVIGTYLIKNNFVGKGLNKGVFSSRECLKQSEMLSLSDWIAIRIFISPFAHLLLREVNLASEILNRKCKPFDYFT